MQSKEYSQYLKIDVSVRVVVSNDADYFLYIMTWVSPPGVTRLDLLKLFALFIKIPVFQYFYSENREIMSLACFDLPMANNSSFADLHVGVMKNSSIC